MWIRLALLALLLTGLALADDRADYDLLKLKISEQRRVLGRYHHDRQYDKALKVQEEVAELSRQALELALRSPEIQDSDAWKYHANILRDAGYTEEALEAVDQYMKTPLLKRNGFREGWTKRAEIYKRQLNYPKAQECLAKAMEYTNSPRERFQLLKTQAQLYLKQAEHENALEKAVLAQKLVADIEEAHRLNARRDMQSLFVKIYREMGESEKARDAKLKELELRQELLNKEIEQFNWEYPED
jgi:tetratricopeptide (TPR) repeat protein